MNRVADFNSILQIAFGMNVLFYVFDFVPYVEGRLKGLSETNRQLAEKKIKLTGNHEVFPIGFVVSATYPFHKWLLVRLSALMSIIVLALMVYDSFHPDAQVSTVSMWGVLVPAFALPSVAFYCHWRTVRLAEAANAALEKQIEEVQRKSS
jgi:hypothetical protein